MIASERVVGWYSSGPKMKTADLDIHRLCMRYAEHPVFVVVDVNIRRSEQGLPIECYVAEESIQNVWRSVFLFPLPQLSQRLVPIFFFLICLHSREDSMETPSVTKCLLFLFLWFMKIFSERFFSLFLPFTFLDSSSFFFLLFFLSFLFIFFFLSRVLICM